MEKFEEAINRIKQAKLTMERKKIAIVGVGLIGGSLAIRLHEKKISSRLIGVDANPAHAALAIERELVDEMLPLPEAIRQADVIILAVPVDTLVSSLPQVLDRVDQQIVLDLGSTKSQPVEAVKHHPLPRKIRGYAPDVGNRIRQRTRCRHTRRLWKTRP